MATFRVGQRVRLVRTFLGSSSGRAIGSEGTIVGFGFWPEGSKPCMFRRPLSFASNVLVDFDGHGEYYQHTNQLEPVQYDGANPVAWAECLWQPNKELVT